MPHLNNPDLDRTIGQRIRQARGLVEPPMGQTALALALGCSFQQVQKYEKGVNAISATTLRRLSDIFDKPLAWFFEGEPPASAGEPEQDAA